MAKILQTEEDRRFSPFVLSFDYICNFEFEIHSPPLSNPAVLGPWLGGGLVVLGRM